MIKNLIADLCSSQSNIFANIYYYILLVFQLIILNFLFEKTAWIKIDPFKFIFKMAMELIFFQISQ